MHTLRRQQSRANSPGIYRPPVSSNLTERIGVEQVRAKFVSELGWYPREPERPDYGIDLYVECADDGRPNGRLLGVQVKSGASYFASRAEEGYIFRGEARHLAYWLRHSLPVILALHDPEHGNTHWVAVTENAVARTRAGWKIVVPRDQLLDADAKTALRRLADGDPYVLALRRLRADVTWMRHLASDGRVLLEADEWVNKTSGRGEIRLLAETRDGSVGEEAEWLIFAGLRPYGEVLPDLFPWADLSVDEFTYEDAEEIVTETPDSDLRPYSDDGEVARWRLELSLNRLGEAFLAVDEHLLGESGASA
jgi:Domain of unknown function (DUF4365)